MGSQLPPSSPTHSTNPLGGFDGAVPDDEALVAYLDGELDRGSATAMETKLAASEPLRRRLNDLRVAWDLLEELPTVDPNPRFAQSTIEMVALSASSIAGKNVDQRGRWRWTLLVLITIPLMFTLGYTWVRSSLRADERKAIEDIPVLADWHALKDVGTYAWLQQVRTVVDLDRVARRSSTAILAPGQLVPPTLVERREWIQSLSTTNRDRLSENLVEFKRANPQDKQRVVDLAEQIYNGPDPMADMQAARDYAQFLSEMSITDRTAHRDQQDMTQRLDDLSRRVNRRMVEVYTQELHDESPDRIAVRQWMQEMENQYGSSLPRGVRSDLMRRMFDASDSIIDEADLENLLQRLTPQAQEIIGRIRSKVAQHAALILYFVNDAQPFFPSGRLLPDRTQLSQRFEELPISRQGMIEFLPPELAQESLGMRSENNSPGGTNPAQTGDTFRPSFPPGPPPASSRNQMRQDVIERSENAADSKRK